MSRRLLLATLLGCVALAGCQDPYRETERGDARPAARNERPAAARPPAARPRGDELAPPPPARRGTPPFHAASARSGASPALETFCGQWANWSWRTIGRQHRRLAELATGPLAEQLAAQARQAKLDQTLRDRLAMRGRVVAVDLQLRDRPGWAVCVTREQEIQNRRAELGGGRHRVYLATLERTPKGWGVSRWEPQP